MSPCDSFGSSLVQAVRHIGIVLLVALASATVVTMWSPSSFLPPDVASAISIAMATRVEPGAAPLPPTATPAPSPTIGVVAGHSGPQNDPGAVCPDGLTEASVNLDVANRVKAILEQAGY